MEIAMYVLWPIIAIIAIIIELNTLYQIGWAISIGSIFALIMHGISFGVLNGDMVWLEFAVLGGVWSLSWIILFLLRNQITYRLHDKEDGFMSYINETFKAIKGNEEEYGELKIGSKIFRFKLTDEIMAGDNVRVKSIKGVTFIVKKEGK